MNYKRLVFVVLPVSVMVFSSCTTYKNVPYFQNFSDSSKPLLTNTVPFKSPVIQIDDVLSINIQTLDQGITGFLNTPQTNTIQPITTGLGAQGPAVNGYLVDKNGEVELPFIGKIKLAGLTSSEARDKIQVEVAKLFNNPVVNVRFANYKVTVLGEVNHPGAFVLPNEKVNIFDGLALAGDLTIFGRRENVMLIRDSMDAKLLVRLNLNEKEIINSPYFYLKSNDIVYIEPNKYKVASVDAIRNRNITIAASVLSVILIIFSRVIK